MDGQPVQTVPSQFQLCELKQLTHRLGEHSQCVVPQEQGLELGASEQSFGQQLQLVGVHGQVLEVVQEPHIWREHSDGVMAQVQVPQFR